MRDMVADIVPTPSPVPWTHTPPRQVQVTYRSRAHGITWRSKITHTRDADTATTDKTIPYVNLVK